MRDHDFDVIVIGARCAGAPTAMLLARKGYEVLVVDRATFPSDTLSTHIIQPQGVRSLERWGLLERVVASGCPPIHTYEYHFGPLVLSGSPGTDEARVAYCPRRTVLDEILVDAAVEAGAELREGFTVDAVLGAGGRVAGVRGHRRGGPEVSVTAPLVIGADGHHSMLAKSVSPETYDERPALQGGYYAYWSELPVDGRFEISIGNACAFGAAPTNDGLTMVVGSWPIADYEHKRHEHEKSYLAMFDQYPEFRERARAAHLESKLRGGPIPNFFRKPFGPGWALVGDAGYLKDPITAQGISDAFRDAELLTDAIDAWCSGARSYDAAMAEYQARRDAAARPTYGFTCQLAALAPPPPELTKLLAAAAGNQDAIDRFCRVNSGIAPPAEFFSEDNVRRVFAAAAAGSGQAHP